MWILNIAMCCLAGIAMTTATISYNNDQSGTPSNLGQHHQPLASVPDVSSYNHLTYAQPRLQNLGATSYGQVPPAEVKVSKILKVIVPRPYVLKLQQKVPVIVEVAKPYPVHITKLVHASQVLPVDNPKATGYKLDANQVYNQIKQQSTGYNEAYDRSDAQHQIEGQSFNAGSVHNSNLDSSLAHSQIRNHILQEGNGGYSNENNAYQNQGTYPSSSQNVGTIQGHVGAWHPLNHQ